MTGKPKRSRLWNVVATTLGLTFVIGLPSLIGFSCYRDHQVRKARNAFNFMLAGGNYESAYDLLSSKRRGQMSLQEFEAYAAHPVIRALDQGYYDQPQTRVGGVCFDGYVRQPDGRWYVQLFFVREQGQWRIDTIALQRPSKVYLGTLLPECGYWKGNFVGYNGPPPEHILE